MKYTITQSSLIIEIIKIRFKNKDYTKAYVNWIDKATGKTIYSERNLKIPNKCFTFWEIVK
jgi:hypothetical protein